MITEFALDLKTARRKAGLRQRDSAHLIGISQSRLSSYELGKAVPTITEVCALSLVYGRDFDSLLAEGVRDARRSIAQRLATMPPCHEDWCGNRNRQQTLNRLAELLSTHTEMYDA